MEKTKFKKRKLKVLTPCDIYYNKNVLRIDGRLEAGRASALQAGGHMARAL